MYTDEQFVADVLDFASWACLLDAGGYIPLPTTDVLAFVASLPVGCVVLVFEEFDEVQFSKTEQGWVFSY